MNEWHDLTHIIDADIYQPPTFPPLAFASVAAADVKPQATTVTITSHVGTHLDAPSHVVEGGATITDLAMVRLTGEAVVWGIDAEDDEEITQEQLASMLPVARGGDAVVLVTGRHSRYRDSTYAQHPFLSEDAARWLVATGVHLVALDCLSPELPRRLRPPGHGLPVHEILLGNDVLIIENVADASLLVGHRVELIVGVVPFRGLDGAQVRLLARIISDTVRTDDPDMS
jgi:kynurenine formamidase